MTEEEEQSDQRHLHGASIIEYAAPMKKGYEQYAASIVVNWPRRWRDKNTNDLSS